MISKKVLREFWEAHTDAKSALKAWHKAVERADWRDTVSIKAAFPKVSILGDRAIFNIKGNKYRLVVHVTYPRVYVRFVGTHAKYDQIDARTI